MKDFQSNYIEKNMKDINLKEAFAVIKRRFWIVIMMCIALFSAGYFYSHYSYTPTYETSTRIIIDADNNYMNTLMVMIKDPSMMEKVQKELDINKTPESIANQININQVDDSLVINISVIDQNPKIAMDIANLTASTFKNEVKEILNFDDVQLLTEAKENSMPINAKTNNMAIVGLVAGFVIGVGLVFLIDSLDESILEQAQVEELIGVPVIGIITKINIKKHLIKQEQNVVGLRKDKVNIHE